MRLRTGQRLGKYRIQRRLAEGGFAEVYRAFDTIEGVPVALKIPHAHMTPRMLEDFRKEVRLTARLDHPNILQIKNAQFIDGMFAIAYPLGECSLEDRMQRRMKMQTRLELAEQMLEAAAFAHRRRVIHCDLKPDNLILFPDHGGNGDNGRAHPGFRLRLTDFGISKLSARTVLASGSGTIGYVAPEQAMGRASFRSDVFSLGLILWQLFSGELPEWPFEWPPPGAERVRKHLHPDFIAFLRRSMRVNQALRFDDADAMRSAFLRLKKRGCLLPRAGRNGRRKKAQTASWRDVRFKQFERAYRQPLALNHHCTRCDGPMSEAMRACPWCGHETKTYRGETRHPERCPRCKRGRKLDWKYCPWCYGAGFRSVATRAYTDRFYSERCRAPGCERREMWPFMRYCPWCRAKTRKAWKIEGSKHSCGRCGWGVLPDYWKFCPWCAKKQPVR